jgi:hypothetical protein
MGRRQGGPARTALKNSPLTSGKLPSYFGDRTLAARDPAAGRRRAGPGAPCLSVARTQSSSTAPQYVGGQQRQQHRQQTLMRRPPGPGDLRPIPESAPQGTLAEAHAGGGV